MYLGNVLKVTPAAHHVLLWGLAASLLCDTHSLQHKLRATHEQQVDDDAIPFLHTACTRLHSIHSHAGFTPRRRISQYRSQRLSLVCGIRGNVDKEGSTAPKGRGSIINCELPNSRQQHDGHTSFDRSSVDQEMEVSPVISTRSTYYVHYRERDYAAEFRK